MAGGVITEVSIDHALNGKHFKRKLHCLRLIYEALITQLVKLRLMPNLADEMMDNLWTLRNKSFSQESLAAVACTILEDDDDFESLIAQLFTQVEASELAHLAWDTWIEYTLNKHSKMMLGCLSLLQNEKQLLVYSRK